MHLREELRRPHVTLQLLWEEYYSAPYRLIRQPVLARYTQASVELFHQQRRVAVHVRSFQKGHHTTLAEHRPPAHRKYLEWTPERIVGWAEKVGPNCRAAAAQIMAERALPEHGIRPCLGLIRLGRRYGEQRVDQACGRALKLNLVG